MIRAYHEAVSEAVRRFDGYIAKFMGDGVSKRKYLMSSQPRRIRRKSCAGSSIAPDEGSFVGQGAAGSPRSPKAGCDRKFPWRNELIDQSTRGVPMSKERPEKHLVVHEDEDQHAASRHLETSEPLFLGPSPKCR